MIEGWYYLHENGELLYKRDLGDTVADLRESDFVKSIWPCDPTDRAGAWRILVEALSFGANKGRVDELAKKWKCNDKDAQNYANYLGITIELDGNSWCAKDIGFVDLMQSKAGFGDTCLEAIADLCKNVGILPGKMWNKTFHDYCKQKGDEF